MKLGDKAVVRGHGRMREGVIDKLTETYAWVRYKAPHGREHAVRTRRSAVFPTAEAYQASEDARRREYEDWQRTRTRRPLVNAALAIGARAPKEETR